MTKTWGIHWFRRDLRLAGNLALTKHLNLHQGRVVGLFAFDETFLARKDFSHDRFQFFLETLSKLRADLEAAGGDLLVLGTGPDEAFVEIFNRCKAQSHTLPNTVSWSRDYEPFARQRDERMSDFFSSQSIQVFTERDHLLIEPHELLNGQNLPYQVYSPFAKRWFDLLKTPEIAKRIQEQRNALSFFSQKNPYVIFDLKWKSILKNHLPDDQLQSMRERNKPHVTVPIPEAGSKTAMTRLKQFEENISKYGTDRDIPSLDGTSKFSIYFKNGSLTVPQVIAALRLENQTFNAGTGESIFLKELAWREFYYHLLWHTPRVERESFKEQYGNLAWEDDEKRFKAWKEGKTGFPIVDAGMRQLLQTGWMHNRVRMIVASFLTKDLLVNWQWGERWFMERLLDGDLAPNNGGWQWAASTGCDAQPYFRIFNPTSQSERFDPSGTYIKTYVPELKDIPTKFIHDPSDELRRKCAYPQPIVDHARQRTLALKLYKR